MRALALALALVTLAGCELLFSSSDDPDGGPGTTSTTTGTSGTTGTTTTSTTTTTTTTTGTSSTGGTSGSTGSVDAGPDVLRWGQMSFPAGDGLNAISGNAANNVYAVGNVGIIGRWDGSTWSVAANQGGNENLTSVYVSPGGTVYVAGGTHLLRCAAPCTQQSDLAQFFTARGASAVCGQGETVYAVGTNAQNNDGVLYRYEASTSTWVDEASPIAVAPVLDACWIAGDGTVFFGGQDRLYSYAGGVVTPEVIDPAAVHLGTEFYSIWGAGSAVFAAGTGRRILSRDESGTWRQVFTPPGDYDFHALAGAGPGEAFAVGEDDGVGSLARFDGTAWTLEPTTGLRGYDLWGLWAADADTYYAVGSLDNSFEQVILRGAR